MDTLKYKATGYMKLFPYDYYFKLFDDTEFKLNFQGKYFPHLIGLHKLKDNTTLNKLNDKTDISITGKSIFKDIIQGNITEKDIKSSVHFNEIKERYNTFNFTKIKDLIYKNVVVSFDNIKIGSNLNKVEIILFEVKNKTFYHLGLGKDKKGFYYPNTFFVRNNDDYIKTQDIVKVKSLKIVDFKKKKVINHIKYIDNIRSCVITNVDKINLDNVKNAFNIEPNNINIDKCLHNLNKMKENIKIEKNKIILKEDKFKKAKIYLQNIQEIQDKLNNMSFFQKISNKKLLDHYNKYILHYNTKLHDLNIFDNKDYNKKLTKFKLEKEHKLTELDNIEFQTNKQCEILINGKKTLKYIKHKEIIEFYKDECATTKDWGTNITSKIHNLNEKEGKILSFEEIENYNGKNVDIAKTIKSLLKGLTRLSNFHDR